jgi:hypothetical protein
MLRLEVKQLREAAASLSASVASALDKGQLKDPSAPYWAGLGAEAEQLATLDGLQRVRVPAGPRRYPHRP